MKRYELIIQDTFKELELGHIYNIMDNIIYNDDANIKMYRVTNWQLENMFKEV